MSGYGRSVARWMVLGIALLALAASARAEETAASAEAEKAATGTGTEKAASAGAEKAVASADPGRLEDVVVTAARERQSASDAPASTSVVTSGEMKLRHVQTVDDAVDLLPGVFSRRSKGLGDTLSSITLRGIPGQNRTLVMVDGVPLNDAYTGAVQMGGLRPEEFQRIEVVRGPVSSLYGGSGMGGVVNLITAMPDRLEASVSGGYGGAFHSGTAQADLWKIGGSIGDRFGNFRIYGALTFERTGGYPTALVLSSSAPPATVTGATSTTDYTGKPSYLIGDTGTNGWSDYSGTLRLQYDFSKDTNVSVTYRRTGYSYGYGAPHSYLENASGAPVFAYGTVYPSTFLSAGGTKAQDSWALGLETLLGETRVKSTFGAIYHGVNWYVSPVSGASGSNLSGGPGKLSSTPDLSLLGEVQVSQPILQRHLLTGGIAFRRDKADTQDTALSNWLNENTTGAALYNAGGINTTYSAFLQAEIALLDSLTLYAGLRDDYWRTFAGYAVQQGTGGFSNAYPSHDQNALSPKGALIWKPLDGTVLRAEVGKAFRSPTVYELYRTWSSTTAGKTTTYQSNPGLSPETIVSWDAGGEQALWPLAKLKATYFDNYLKDMVYLVTTSDSATAATKIYQNVGAAHSNGVELELEQKIRKLGRIFAAYTYTHTAITEDSANPALVGKQLTMVPKHMVSGGAEAAYGPVSGSMTVRYVAKRFGQDNNSDTVNNVYSSYDPYLVTDLKISVQPVRWATLSFSVDNLFDARFFGYYRAPGRSWFTELALTY